MNTHHQKIKVRLLPILIAIAMFMQMLDSSILNTAIPSIAKDFGELPIKLDIAVTAFIFTAAIFLPISGWLADRFNVAKVFFTAIALFSLGSLLCALSQNLFELTASRVVQGIGGAIFLPVGRLIILKTVPRESYLKVMTYMVMPAMIGPILGPTVGGFLAEYLSWHWIFLINVPIGIFCLTWVFFFMPYIAPVKAPKFDWMGFIIFDIAILLFFWSGVNISILGIPQEASFFLGLVFILLYGFHAKRKTNPLFSLEIFKNRTFTIGVLGNLITRLSAGAIPFLMPLFMQIALGFSPSKSGMSLMPLTIGAAIITSQVSRIVKKFGYRNALITSSIFIAGGIFCFGFMGESVGLIMIIIMLILGMAVYMQFSAMTALALKNVENKFLSQSNSVISSATQISMALGVSFSATILERLSGGQSPHIQQFHTEFFIVAIFSLISSVIFLFINKDDGKDIKV